MKPERNILNARDVCASEQEVADWEYGNNFNVILMLISCLNSNSMNSNLMRGVQQDYYVQQFSSIFLDYNTTSLEWMIAEILIQIR